MHPIVTYWSLGIDFVDLSYGATPTIDIRFISDTHDCHDDIKEVEVDAIIHTGDETSSRDLSVNNNLANDFFCWYARYPSPIKLYVPGNHSLAVHRGMIKQEDLTVDGIQLLVDLPVNLYGYRVYGSPWTPLFGQCAAFMRKRNQMKPVWDAIPDNTEILVTHGPPKGILDLAPDMAPESDIAQVGCKALRNRVNEVGPLIHAFGHLHDMGDELLNYGVLRRGYTTYINASCCDLRGTFKHQGVVVRLARRN